MASAAASTPVPTKVCPTVVLYSAREYDESSFGSVFSGDATVKYLAEPLTLATVEKSAGFNTVCAFVNDDLSAKVLTRLKDLGVVIVAMRCAGFNNVDVEAAVKLGLKVVRVPAYSPAAVAEHAVTLMMALNRNLRKSTDRTRKLNFELSGLTGHDIKSRTVGVVGTGKIGMCFLRILHGFGARLLAHDIYQSPEAVALGVEYVPLDDLLARSDIVSLHTNLSPETAHLIGARAFSIMKRGAMLINTSRGGLIDTAAAIEALKSGQLGHLGIDVVEDEGSAFFHYASAKDVSDDICRLLCMSNVLVTGHQAFLTYEALENIATTTAANVVACLAGAPCPNEVLPPSPPAAAPPAQAAAAAVAPPAAH